MIIDQAKIKLKAGDGGDGGVFFRREKFVPKGGPDGGDGGDGGDIILEASRHVDDLTEFARNRSFKAEDGGDGMKQKMSGKHGQNLILKVPLGTQIFEDEKLISDMTEEGKKIKIVKGGSGGWGNHHFATSIKQAPEWAKEGLPGEAKKIRLELKMIADIGLVGLPNAGKSTLLSVISNARPRIADYPFTTLEPNLGAVRYENKTIIVADIPGLIEGAADGKGLGHKFLKHIERTKAIVHLLDVSSESILREYDMIRGELKKFSKELTNKPELVVLNKIELVSKEKIDDAVIKLRKRNGNIQKISAVAQKGTEELKYAMMELIN